MGGDPRKDPRRRCLRLEEWPAQDRAAWERATRSGDPFEGAGPAGHWRPGTRQKVAASYGRWLTFLACRAELDPAAGPAERVTEGHLRAYYDELNSQVSPVTVAGRIVDLHEALRVMEPRARLPFLTRAMHVLQARARPVRNKRARYVHPGHVFGRALKLLGRIEQKPCPREVWRSGRFRDALMVAMLTAWPVRRRNFCGIVIGRNLLKVGDRYTLRFEGKETKNHRPIEATLPVALTPDINRYLEVHRPRLLAGRSSDRFWISNRGTDMAEVSIYFRIREVTRRELGIALSMHAFRDGPPTALATDDPAHVGAAMPILGHTDPRVAEKHYNQARAVEAARRYQASLQELRRLFLPSRRTKRPRPEAV